MRKSVLSGHLPDTDTPSLGPEDASSAGTAPGHPAVGADQGDASTQFQAGLDPSSLSSDDLANLNDARLVELARHGDHRAFAILVHRYERKLVGVLARLIHDPELARDLRKRHSGVFTSVWSGLIRRGDLGPGSFVWE